MCYSISIPGKPARIGELPVKDLPPVEVTSKKGNVSPIILVGLGLLLYMAIK
jgi:hypothetical protein